MQFAWGTQYRPGHWTVATKYRIFLDYRDFSDIDWRRWLLFGALAVLLELYLATREKRWPGLLLPGAALAGAAVKAYLFYAENTPSGMALGAALALLALYGVPAMVLLAVYAVCRERRRRKQRRDQAKMHIDDV